jgi:Tol biopolymer transport system component
VLAGLALAGCGRYAPGTLPTTEAVTADAAWDGDAALSPDGRTIAFVSERADGGRGLFLEPAKGGPPKALITGPGDVSRPSWSRDGHRLLFTRIDPATGEGRAMVAAVQAGAQAAPRTLGLKGGDVRDAVLSPDGSSVAYVVHTDSTWSLCEARVSDLTAHPLFDGLPREAISRPAWGKKGLGLVFAFRGDLWWIARAGGAPTQLTFSKAAEREPAVSPDGKWVAFVSDSTGTGNVWIARLTGPGGKRPAALGAWRPASASFQPLGHPAWSADGHTLWFDRQDPWVVAAIDAAGGAPDTLSSSLFDSREPSYLGDDTRVVFSSVRTGPSRIWIMAASGEARSGPAKQLTMGPGEDVEPAASQASGQVVYVSRMRDLGTATLVLTDATGAAPGALTLPDLAGIEQATRDESPAWSRDGRNIVFASNRGNTPAIWALEGVGRRLRAVTATDGEARTPCWSADGNFVFYGARESAGTRLWRVPAAGGASTPWTSDDVPGSADTQPAVSPDGTKLVFTRQRHGDRDLWIMDSGGGAARALVTNPRGQDAHASWSSDSRRLVYETGGAVNLYRADVRPLLLR